MTDAYNTLVSRCDLIRTLFRFYPLAIQETTSLWFGASSEDTEKLHLEVFPDEPSAEAAIAKLLQTEEPMLRFGIVHLASAFEDYLNDVYIEHVRLELGQNPQRKIELSEEFKVQIDDFGGELNAFLAQERERFSMQSWKRRLSDIMRDIDVQRVGTSEPISNSDKMQTLGMIFRLDTLEEITAIRNLVLHNNGKVNDRFLRRFPNSAFVKNGAVHASGTSVESVRGEILEIGFYIDSHYMM